MLDLILKKRNTIGRGGGLSRLHSLPLLGGLFWLGSKAGLPPIAWDWCLLVAIKTVRELEHQGKAYWRDKKKNALAPWWAPNDDAEADHPLLSRTNYLQKGVGTCSPMITLLSIDFDDWWVAFILMLMCDCECIFIFYLLTKHEAHKAYKLFSSAFMTQTIYGNKLLDSFLPIWVFELYMESLDNILWMASLEAIYIYEIFVYIWKV